MRNRNNQMNEEFVKELLGEDEDLFFTATPTRKLFTKNELIRIPISFGLIGAFLIYYYFFATIDPKVVVLTISVAVVFILYNALIKTVIKLVKRNHTIYYITSRNVGFILTDSKGRIKKNLAFKISDVVSCTVVMNKDDTGNVLFSETKQPESYQIKIGNNWISHPSGVVPIFFDITNANEAEEIFSRIRQSIKREKATIDNMSFSKYDE